MENKTTLNKYKKFLKSSGLQPSTVKNYLWHVDKFLHWNKDKKLTEAEFKKYFNYLLKKYKQVRTINLRLIILNNYFKFLNKRFRFTLLSHQDSSVDILNEQQLQEFLDQPLKENSLVGLRNKALLELLYSTGLKVGQIVKLKREYIDDIKKELILENKKHIDIKALTWFHLEKYLQQRQDDSSWLFTNLDRAKKSEEDNLSIRSVERIISKYGQQLEPSLKITPQILRNTLAWQLKQEGAQVGDIKKALHFKTKLGAKNYLQKI